ncbi:MAG: hypothetical protein J6J53_05785 [Muribaculaceae bacterium]|nr:hypothetical protein [Muribaculaceae bacterium]
MTRADKIKNFMLSPGVSILAGVLGLALWSLTAAFSYQAAAISVLTVALITREIKARTLYRGPNFTIIGLFIMLQAAVGATFTGCLIALTGAIALTGIISCFARPDKTRLLFLIYMVLGLGAMVCRSFAILAPVMLAPLILIRAFSPQGLMAAILGFITPAIILCGFGVYDAMSLQAIYTSPFTGHIGLTTIAAVSAAALSVIATFFRSYGYPAKMRAGNLAILGLTLMAAAAPLANAADAGDYLPLVNLCTAYNIAHFSAYKKFGWIAAVVVYVAAGVFIFLPK